MRLRTEDVSRREIDGEMVVLDLRTSTYLTANRVGTLLLRLLDEPRSLDELTEALTVGFGISRSRASADAAAFLAELERRGLLEHAAPGTSAGAVADAPPA